MISESGSRKREKNPFRQSTGRHLRRGKACLNCRYLKIKCDGIKPTCGACIRVPKDDPCEFTDGPSRTVMLQQTVTRLQARVQELEGTGSSHYSKSRASTPSASSSGESIRDSNSPVPPPHQSHTRSDQDSVSNPRLQDSQSLENETHIHAFLNNCSHLGFFLNIDRFRQSLHTPGAPLALRTLQSAACLWGIHISQQDSPLESNFLEQCLSGMSFSTSVHLDPGCVMDIIQVHVLLAAYYLRKNQFLDSEYYVNGAVSLCISHGLHQVHYTNRLLGVVEGKEIFSIAPRNAVDLTERINGFWAVFNMQRQMLISRYPSSSAFGTLCSWEAEIKTPWPGSGDEPGATFEYMYTKATILLHRACHLLSKSENTQSLMIIDQPTLFDEYIQLTDLITQFRYSLPPLNQINGTLITIHCMASTAYFKAQEVVGDTSPSCLEAALGVLQMHYNFITQGRGPFDPFAGTLCSMAAKYLMKEKTRIDLLCAGIAWNVNGLVQDPLQEQARVNAAVEEAKSIIMYLSSVCPSMRYHGEKLCQLYQAL